LIGDIHPNTVRRVEGVLETQPPTLTTIDTCCEVQVMAARNRTASTFYVNPNDPATWLKPGEPLFAGGFDWSWCYVVYRAVPGHPGYCIGTNGSLWTCRAYRGLGYGKGTESYLSANWKRKHPFIDRDGYEVASLSDGPRSQSMRIHALVLSVFVGPRKPGQVCRHLNGVRSCNRLSNLAWGTPLENCQDRESHQHTARGEKSGQAKLTRQDVIEIRRLRTESKWTFMRIAKFKGISKRQAMRVYYRQSWNHVA